MQGAGLFCRCSLAELTDLYSCQPAHAETVDACCRELDGERDAIELPT